MGRPLTEKGKGIRKDRYVGIFYFIWHGAHGYDSQRVERKDEGIQDKLPGDTVSPYDITQLLAADSIHPKLGPYHANITGASLPSATSCRMMNG